MGRPKKTQEIIVEQLGSTFGCLNKHDLIQLGIYLVLFIAYNLGVMGLEQLDLMNFGAFDWIREPAIFILSILTKKILQDKSNLFIKR